MVSDIFKRDVEAGNLRKVRIMLKDSMLIDPSLNDFEENLQYAASKMSNLYDKHDGRPLSEDRSAWTQDYMNMEMVRLVNNFSRERIDNLRKVVKYLYPTDLKNHGDSPYIFTYPSGIHLPTAEDLCGGYTLNNILSNSSMLNSVKSGTVSKEQLATYIKNLDTALQNINDIWYDDNLVTKKKEPVEDIRKFVGQSFGRIDQYKKYVEELSKINEKDVPLVSAVVAGMEELRNTLNNGDKAEEYASELRTIAQKQVSIATALTRNFVRYNMKFLSAMTYDVSQVEAYINMLENGGTAPTNEAFDLIDQVENEIAIAEYAMINDLRDMNMPIYEGAVGDFISKIIEMIKQFFAAIFGRKKDPDAPKSVVVTGGLKMSEVMESIEKMRPTFEENFSKYPDESVTITEYERKLHTAFPVLKDMTGSITTTDDLIYSYYNRLLASAGNINRATDDQDRADNENMFVDTANEFMEMLEKDIDIVDDHKREIPDLFFSQKKTTIPSGRRYLNTAQQNINENKKLVERTENMRESDVKGLDHLVDAIYDLDKFNIYTDPQESGDKYIGDKCSKAVHDIASMCRVLSTKIGNNVKYYFTLYFDYTIRYFRQVRDGMHQYITTGTWNGDEELSESAFIDDNLEVSLLETALLNTLNKGFDNAFNEGFVDFIKAIIEKIKELFAGIFGGGNKHTTTTSYSYTLKSSTKLSDLVSNIKEMTPAFQGEYNNFPDESLEINRYMRNEFVSPQEFFSESYLKSKYGIQYIDPNKLKSYIGTIIAEVKSYKSSRSTESENKVIEVCGEAFQYIGNALKELDKLSEILVGDSSIFFEDKKTTTSVRRYIKDKIIPNVGNYESFADNLEKCDQESVAHFQFLFDCITDIDDQIGNQYMNPDSYEYIGDSLKKPISNVVSYISMLIQKTCMYFKHYVNSMCHSMITELIDAGHWMNSYITHKTAKSKEESEEAHNEFALIANIGNRPEPFSENSLSDYVATAWSDYQYDVYHIINNAIIEEVKIRANPDADLVYEMQLLNEKVTKDISKGFDKFVMSIKSMFSKFMEKIRANISTTRHYLDKYKKVILSSKVPSDYTSKNILAGMDRCLNYELPAFNYAQLKANLDTPYNFFTKLVTDPHASITSKFQPSPDAEVNEQNYSPAQVGKYFKEYFGMTPGDRVITANQVQERIKDIYDFLYDANRIEKNIKQSIKRVEDMRYQAMKQAGVPQSKPTSDGITDAKDAQQTRTGTDTGTAGQQIVKPNVQQASVESAFFSYLYGDLSPYLEIERNNIAQNRDAAVKGNQTGKVAQNMKNVGQMKPDENGNIEYGTNGTPVEEVNKHCNNYAEVCIKVLEAKFTATEFIRSELMSLVRDIVAAYVDGETTQSPTKRNGSTVVKKK